MKGLLVKDFYTLAKQVRFLLLVLVIMSIIPGASMAPFAIVYSVMLPVTVMGYDERSKWDRYASMLPYSKTSLVISKYIVGYICLAIAVSLSVVSEIVFTLVKGEELSTITYDGIIALGCFALLFLAINLPFMFKFGVEKGRLAFFVLTAIIVGGVMIISDQINKGRDFQTLEEYLYILPIVIVILNFLSMYISVKIYEKREF